MSKIGSLLKDEILRLARKEVRTAVRSAKKASTQHRRDIAELKRQVKALALRVAQSEKRTLNAVPAAPAEGAKESLRFSAKGLRSQRKRLGLSAAQYGKLVGVTQLSIYNWERGVTRPRQEWLSALVALRGLSKKEAMARLEERTVREARKRAKKPATKRGRRRRKS
jgi:DNA-binding transcriptional regulator YiaG